MNSYSNEAQFEAIRRVNSKTPQKTLFNLQKNLLILNLRVFEVICFAQYDHAAYWKNPLGEAKETLIEFWAKNKN